MWSKSVLFVVGMVLLLSTHVAGYLHRPSQLRSQYTSYRTTKSAPVRVSDDSYTQSKWPLLMSEEYHPAGGSYANNTEAALTLASDESVDLPLDPNLAPKVPEADDVVFANSSAWPCGDALDQRIAKLALPAVLNFVMYPLVGAADTFWVGRMKNALALAGQGAANQVKTKRIYSSQSSEVSTTIYVYFLCAFSPHDEQVFDSAYWVMSFLPSVMSPMVAKAHSSGDQEAVQQRIGEVFLICTILGQCNDFIASFR